MNIKDVKDIPASKHFLKDIFNTQHELAVKYKEIEGIPDWPFDIDSLESQIWIKDFLWRSAEELAEALEALDHQNEEHFLEELADALHFIVEAIILAGVEDRIKNQDLHELAEAIKGTLTLGQQTRILNIQLYSLVYFKSLGLVGNTLKNKKWKKTQVLTDYNKFVSLITKSFKDLIQLFVVAGCDAQDIYNLYYKKSRVNKFRQDSNY